MAWREGAAQELVCSIPYPILLTTTLYSTQTFIELNLLNYYLMLRSSHGDGMAARYNSHLSISEPGGHDFTHKTQLEVMSGQEARELRPG